jgi:large exoprotein involved in heme utilization and adhesion
VALTSPRVIICYDGALLVTSTLGRGYAGSVTIRASDRCYLMGWAAMILQRSSQHAGIYRYGKGGDIDITTGSLFVTDGAQLAAGTFGQGAAGT